MAGYLDDDFDSGVLVDPDPFVDNVLQQELDNVISQGIFDEYDEDADDEYADLDF